MHLDPDASFEARASEDVHNRLQQIADVLGCPAADFFGLPPPRADLGGAAELLGLWNAVTDEAVRAKLLNCLREAASANENHPVAAGRPSTSRCAPSPDRD